MPASPAGRRRFDPGRPLHSFAQPNQLVVKMSEFSHSLERSFSPGDEARDPCLDDRIEPDSCTDSLSYLFDGVIGKRRDVKIFLDVADAGSCRERSRAALQRPG